MGRRCPGSPPLSKHVLPLGLEIHSCPDRQRHQYVVDAPVVVRILVRGIRDVEAQEDIGEQRFVIDGTNDAA